MLTQDVRTRSGHRLVDLGENTRDVSVQVQQAMTT